MISQWRGTMHIPALEDVEMNLRHCLLLKADDLYFTLAEPEGEALRNGFLGVPVEGLADENLSEEEISLINLERFAIAAKVRELHTMLAEHRLSLRKENYPDAEDGRVDALEFLEYFLSTLPDVALGGTDLTTARNGEIRQIYNLAYAWLNLIDSIHGAFHGETESTLAVNDLALLSGLDTRTLRNRCGPGKLLRTSPSRIAQPRDSASQAFVSLHALDAVDWLKSRKGFEIAKIDPTWIAKRLAEATPEQATRGLLIASVVNLGPISAIAPSFGFAPEQAREWFDRGDALQSNIAQALSDELGVTR